MKRISLATTALGVGLLAIAATGCSGEANVVPKPAPVDQHAFDLPRVFDSGARGATESERSVAPNYAAAVGSAGFAKLSALLADDVHYAFPGLSDGRGREGVQRLHETLFGAFDDRALAISRIWRTDSAQAVEWTMTGTQARTFMGVAPTGKRVAFTGTTLIWTKDDGAIVDLHVYFDVAVVKAQLGAGPAELAALTQPTPASGAPQVTEQGVTPEEERNVAAVHAWLDDVAKNDLAQYLDAMTEDVEVYSAERAQPARGKPEAKAAFAALHRAIAQLETTVDNKWGFGKSVVVEYALNGEQIAALGWVPAGHDKVVTIEMVDVIELRDGKIAKVWRYSNPAQIADLTSPLASADAGGSPPRVRRASDR